MLETITAEEFRKRFVELCLSGGPKSLPKRPRDRHIVLKGVVLTLDLRAQYTEAELDTLLERWLMDVGRSINLDRLVLRRQLVDEGYIGRQPDGSRYWVGFFGPLHVRFEAEIDEIDPRLLVQEARNEAERRKQEFSERP